MQSPRIQRIEPFIICSDLAEPFFFSQWRYHSRRICLVRITLEDGTYGWGEGYGPADLIKAGIDFFKPYLINEIALEHETLWQEMYRRSMDYARSGVFQAAISAIDVALWDIKGKLLDQPVAVLLGGIKNPIIEPYATGLYFRDSDNLERDLCEEAIGYKQQGFKATKMKVGLGIEEDRKLVAAVREAIGPDMKLMVDANHAYSYQEAAKLARGLEELDISWFEEPVSPEDYEGYRRLRDTTTIPVAGGECEYLKFGFKRLLENECVDIIQPDICATGGLTEAKRIAALAQVWNKDLTPHTWGTAIAISAAAHFVANLDSNPGRMLKDAPTLELDRTENALRDEVTQHALKIQNGTLELSKAPGLGVDVDMDILEHYLAAPEENEPKLEIRS